MAAQKGKDLLIKIDISGTYTTIAGLRSSSISMNDEQSRENDENPSLRLLDNSDSLSGEEHEEEWMSEKDLVLFQIEDKLYLNKHC